ncbi:MAG TPA: hypothetical protein VFZ38_17880 [Vicinamibacterales bacterium]
MELTDEKFWIVWCPTHGTPPRVKHPSIQTALHEAERLARMNPGSEFFVMGAEFGRQVDSMTRVTFEDQLPF